MGTTHKPTGTRLHGGPPEYEHNQALYPSNAIPAPGSHTEITNTVPVGVGIPIRAFGGKSAENLARWVALRVRRITVLFCQQTTSSRENATRPTAVVFYFGRLVVPQFGSGPLEHR